MAKAVGILEVFGLVAGFVAADAGCKAADVTIENFDKNKPGNADALPVPLIVSIKFRGDVAAGQAGGGGGGGSRCRGARVGRSQQTYYSKSRRGYREDVEDQRSR